MVRHASTRVTGLCLHITQYRGEFLPPAEQRFPIRKVRTMWVPPPGANIMGDVVAYVNLLLSALGTRPVV